MAAAGTTGVVDEARMELRAAKSELHDAKESLRAVHQADPQQIAEAKVGVAKAEVGVAKAEVGVAEAKVGVAEAKWEAESNEGKKAKLWELVAGAKAGVDLAREGVKSARAALHVVSNAAAATPAMHPAPPAAAQEGGLEPGDITQMTNALANLGAQLADQQRETREHQREVRDQLALQRLESTLTPSQASTALDTYDRLLEEMNLKVCCEEEIVKLESDSQCVFKFNWEIAKKEAQEAASEVTNAASPAAAVEVEEELEVPEDAPEPHRASCSEKLSYKPLCQYLRGLGKQAYVIANGYNVGSRGLLFDRRAHGMRRNLPTEKGQVVSSSIRVKGRSDLAVLNGTDRTTIEVDSDCRPTSNLWRNSVAWVIEVKESTIRDGACREAITQLIGLNIDNFYTSPKVLLTNLIGTHHVYYIQCETSYPWYSIQWRRCSTLLAAIQFIERLDTAPRSHIAHYFGRATSPIEE